MNKDSVLALVRHLLTFGAGYLVANGVFDQGGADQAVAAAMTLVAIGWSIFDKRGRTLAVLIVAGGLTMGLSACAVAPPTAVQQLTTACNAYASSLYTLAGYRAAGKLTPADVAAVDDARSIVNPICAGPPPADGTASLATVRAALDRYSAIQAGVRP